MDPYKILGIDKNATQAEIRRAYHRQAAKHHPDAGGDDWAFQQVRNAYDTLAKSVAQPVAAKCPRCKSRVLFEQDELEKSCECGAKLRYPGSAESKAEKRSPSNDHSETQKPKGAGTKAGAQSAQPPPFEDEDRDTIRPGRNRRPKKRSFEPIKIVAGGVAGLALGFLLLWYAFGVDPLGVMRPTAPSVAAVKTKPTPELNRPTTKEPPIAEPTTKELATEEPPTKEPPTKEPPTKEPPTKEPPTKEPPIAELEIGGLAAALTQGVWKLDWQADPDRKNSYHGMTFGKDGSWSATEKKEKHSGTWRQQGESIVVSHTTSRRLEVITLKGDEILLEHYYRPDKKLRNSGVVTEEHAEPADPSSDDDARDPAPLKDSNVGISNAAKEPTGELVSPKAGRLKIVVWNTHNWVYRDRGVETFDLTLYSRGRKVWEQSDIEIAWRPDGPSNVVVPIASHVRKIDRLRLDVTKCYGKSMGLAEIQVLLDGKNIAHHCPVQASNTARTTSVRSLTDGHNEDIGDGLGYWMAWSESGWVTVDLSKFDVRRAKSAVVKVDPKVGKWKPLTAGTTIWGDRPYKFTEIPDALTKLAFLEHKTAHQEVLRFSVSRSGTVLMASETPLLKIGDNGITEDELIRDGWTPVETLSAGDVTWKVFARKCQTGERFAFQTRKYAAPILIVPR